jgi:hypothetical protein
MGMPHAYFESDGLAGLKKIYDRALRILEKHQSSPVEVRDTIAARIFSIASDGYPSDGIILKAALCGLVPEASLDVLSPSDGS